MSGAAATVLEERPAGAQSVIGIDVGAREIRAVCVHGAGSAVSISGARRVSLPELAAGEFRLDSASPFVQTLRQVCREIGAGASHVVVGLGGQQLYSSVMQLPNVTGDDLREILRSELDHYRILPTEDCAFDTYPLPQTGVRVSRFEDESRVLVMASRGSLLEEYYNALVGGRVSGVTVEPASIGLLRAQYPLLEAERAVATVMMGPDATEVLITGAGVIHSYRRIEMGADQLGAPGQTNRFAAGQLASEIQRSIDFYIREFPEARGSLFARFFIDAAAPVTLFEVVSSRLSACAELAAVMDTVPVARELLQTLEGTDAFQFVAAAGLALREFEPYAGAPALDLVGGRSDEWRRARWAARGRALAAASTLVFGICAAAGSTALEADIVTAQKTLSQTEIALQTEQIRYGTEVARLERPEQIKQVSRRESEPIRPMWDFIAAAAPNGVSLTGLHIDQAGVIYVNGQTKEFRLAMDFIDALGTSPALSFITLNEMVRVDNSPDSPFKFELQTQLLGYHGAPSQPSFAQADSAGPQSGSGAAQSGTAASSGVKRWTAGHPRPSQKTPKTYPGATPEEQVARYPH